MVRRLDGLYLVAGSETPIESVEAALRGGGRLVQIWSPQRAAHVQSWGQRIRTATQAFDVPLLVNNDLALAQAIGADGLHLDDAHLEPAQIREELGQDAIVGYTCGTGDRRLHLRHGHREGGLGRADGRGLYFVLFDVSVAVRKRLPDRAAGDDRGSEATSAYPRVRLGRPDAGE